VTFGSEKQNSPSGLFCFGVFYISLMSEAHYDRMENEHESVYVPGAARFTRRALKYFVDSRILQGNSWDEIVCLLKNVREGTEFPQRIIPNPKQDQHPQSVPLERFCKDEKTIVVILDVGEVPRVIISLHFRKRLISID
jgi:hypothetical protein